MTSKQALDRLYSGAQRSIYFQEEYDILFNALEILEILKASIFNKEEHTRRMSEPLGDKFLMIGIHVNGDENIEKVKRWLDDN